MDTKTATFTFFALLLLYTVSAARPTVNLRVPNPTVVTRNVLSTNPKIILPGEKVTSDEKIVNNLHTEPKKPTSDPTPRTNFTKFFHPINRHIQGRPHRGPKQTRIQRKPCIKHSQYMTPATKASDRKDKVAKERTEKSRSRTFRGEVSSNWLKVKHHYDSRQKNNNNNNNNSNDNKQHNRNKENVTRTRNVFDREKMKSLSRQQKQKQMKSDHKAGLMKNIRKFLKHTFD